MFRKVTRLILGAGLFWFDVNYCQASAPDNFRQQLLEASAAVTAWQIEYEGVKPSTRRIAPVVHRVVALKGPNSFYHLSTKFAAGSGLSWRDDPLQQLSIVANNRTYWSFPWRRTFQVTDSSDSNLFPGTLPQELLWPMVTWWPITSDSNYLISKEPYLVTDVLRSNDYQFRNDPEIVEGHKCFVLEAPHKAALWFDAERVGALLAREFYAEDTGALKWRLEMAQHKEVKPGVWCPTLLKNIQYNYNSGNTAGRSQRDVDSAYRVLDVRLNEDVPDNLFDIPDPKPGSIQAFEDGSYRQIVADDHDYLDELLGWIKRTVNYQTPVATPSMTECVCYLTATWISLVIIYRQLKRLVTDRGQSIGADD